MQLSDSAIDQGVNGPPSERLHTRVVLVFSLFAIAPLVIGAFMSLVLGIWVARTELSGSQARITRMTGGLVSERWRGLVDELRTAAAVIGETAGGDQVALDLLAQHCGACQPIWLTDRAGQIRLSTTAAIDVPPLSTDVLARIGAGEEQVPTMPTFTRTAMLVLVLPVRSGGALVTQIDVSKFVADVLRVVDFDQLGYGYVVDAHGQLIVASLPGAMVSGQDLRELPIVHAALSGQDWVPPYSQVYIGITSQRVAGMWAPVPGTGWFILVERPLIAEGSSNWYFFVVQSLLLLGTIIVAIMIGRQLAATITQPIERLQRGVMRLRAGHWDQPMRVGRRDELGQLAEAFNTMAGDLQLKQIELRQRGDELALANHELQQALDAAYSANNLKSQFVATISHELRTPLTGVLGYTDMLEMGAFGQLVGDQYEVILRIRENGRHLLQLINDLLDFSKLEAGKFELHNEPFALAEFMDATLATCAPQARAKGIALDLWIDPALPEFVSGDVLRLRQIVLNLISNAVKFTESGHVAVSIRQAADADMHPLPEGTPPPAWLLLEVADTGIGIAPEHHGSVFDAFRQVDGSYTRRSVGSGLGLAITRRLVELMGGQIVLQSELGQGSRFIITLPLIDVAVLA
jgi:signal transduction histidine kinase